jgi:4-amino-4-deoxy-L-arabinose transferase-like glycosyltransferase
VASTLLLEAARDRIGFYEDDGINLLKAFMVARGHPLYREVFSDQAPLYTWILAGALKLGAAGYEPLRQIAIGFGALGLTAAFAIALELGGLAAGVVTLVILGTLAPVLKFFTAVIIGVAALALACSAVAIALTAGERRRPGWSMAAGGLLGAACAVKLSFVYFLPVLLLAGGRRRGWAWLVGGWAAALLGVAGLVDVRAALPQLFGTHLAAYGAFAERAGELRRVLLLGQNLPVLYAVAVVSLVIAVRRRVAAAAVLVWVAIVALWMAIHRPLWPHHLPELLVPLAIAVGTAVGVVLRSGAAWRRLVLAAVPVAVVVAADLAALPRWQRLSDNVPLTTLAAVAERIAALTAPGDRVIVDRPILAFLASREVPPALAMLSRKRVETGGVTEADLEQALRGDRPRLVALCGTVLRRLPGFRAALDRGYTPVHREVLGWRFSDRTTLCQLFTRDKR